MQVIEKLIQSPNRPELRGRAAWIDTSDPSKPVIKIPVNGELREVGPDEADLTKVKKDIKDLQETTPSTIEVSNIQQLTKKQLDALRPGDVVEKITGNQKHTYIVSYKGSGAGEGICLSYNAAGYGETVSYDRTDDGWVYNSTDVVEVPAAQIQSDWNQSDNTAVDYIKNKPTIPSDSVIIVEGIMTGEDTNIFSPAAGSPTLLECYNAFLLGTKIIVKYTLDDGDYVSNITEIVVSASNDITYEGGQVIAEYHTLRLGRSDRSWTDEPTE